MYYRFRVIDGEEQTTTEWKPEPSPPQAAQVQRVAEVTAIRAAQPEAAIYLQRSRVIPE